MSNRFLKIILTAALAGLLVLSLAGCSDKKDMTDSDTTGYAAEYDGEATMGLTDEAIVDSTDETSAEQTQTTKAQTTTLKPTEKAASPATTVTTSAVTVADAENTEATTKRQSNEVVIDAVNYVRDVDFSKPANKNYANDVGPESTKHRIRIPKLNSDTENAAIFNQTIYYDYGDTYQEVLNNEDEEICYTLDYEYTHDHGLVAICVEVCDAYLGSERYDDANYYYYDLNNDRALTLSQYINAIGKTDEEIYNCVNNEIRSLGYDEEYSVEVLGCMIGENKIKAYVILDNGQEPERVECVEATL